MPLKAGLNDGKRPNFSAGEIWWCHLGANVGDEQDGKGGKFLRPVLVVRKLNKNLFVGLALTSKNREKHYLFPVNFKDSNSSVIISQIKTTDSKRLLYRMGKISKNEFENVKEAARKYIFGI